MFVAKILISSLLLVLSVKVDGRDIGLYRPRSPSQFQDNITGTENIKVVAREETVEYTGGKYEENTTTHETPESKLRQEECHIDIRALAQRKPLLRNPRTKELLYPDSVGSSLITLRKGDPIELDCPGSRIVVEGDTAGEVTEAVCVSGPLVRVLGHIADISDILCHRRIASVARYTGDKCFNNRGKEIEVGFEFTDGEFVQEMTACFDEEYREVLYSKFYLNNRIGDQNTGGTRPGWTEGNFYNLGARLNNIYPNVAQRAQINRQLGLPDGDDKYIKATGTYYLAKGHLTARSDFFYYAQQEATFWYINSVPQWQTFNAFNWAYLERNVRQLAYNRRLDFEVVTGGYGHATLPHEITGEQVQLYLYVDENGNQALPVPEIFWKIVYSPKTREGVVIIGLNNPYQEDVSQSIYCKDVADELTWLTFDRTRVVAGYIYACAIDDLRKVIPELPEYRVTNLLR